MSSGAATVEGARGPAPPVGRGERLAIAAIALVAVLLHGAAVLAVQPLPLVGDQPEYDATARLFAQGHPFWGLAPTGVPHPSVWKAPGYGVFAGLVYTVAGQSPMIVGLAQAALGAITIVLVWWLGRRLFGVGVGIAAAAVTSVYPLAWQFETVLYPEALAVPLAMIALTLFLGREPTTRRAIALGVVMGVALLVRPTSFFIFAGVAAAWVVAAGARRGAWMTLLTLAVSVLVIAPWTVRNYLVTNSFVLISVQDAAIHGTFNATSARDPKYPYGWRAFTPETIKLTKQRRRPTEIELRRYYYRLGLAYIRRHPESIPAAFFWNGIYRYWDLRPPGFPLGEVRTEGRSYKLGAIGLAMYYVLLPLALVGLYRARKRREILYPVLAIALAASVVFAVGAGTRYRAPLEPLIVILACSVLAGPLNRAVDRLRGSAAD